MKKLVIATLCGLCLMGAFVCAPTTDSSNEVALSKKLNPVRV